MSDGQKRVLVGASAAARLAAARTWLRASGRAGALVLAPARGAADDLVRSALAPGEGAFGVQRMTPEQLVSGLSLASMADGGRAPVTGLAREALAARAVAGVARSGSLEYFAPVIDTPGFPRALARTLHELRMAAVPVAELASGAPPARDLAKLQVAYEEALQWGGMVDAAGLWAEALLAVRRGRHPWIGLPLLLLDLSPRAEVERDLLRALADASDDVLALLVDGDDEALEIMAGVVDAAPERLDSDPRRSRLARLRRWVFREGPVPVKRLPEDDSVEFLSAPGEARESVEIARRIQALAASGIPFDRQAVLVRDPGAYFGLLEEALDRAGIPAHFTRGTIRPHASGRAFLALLACASDGLSATRFAEYLSLAQVPALNAAGAAPLVEVPWVEPQGDQLVFKSLVPAAVAVATAPTEAEDERGPVLAGTLRTPRDWEQMLVDAAVVGGFERWTRRLAGLRAEHELKLARVDDADEGRRRHLQEQIEGLRNLESFALPVVAFLAGLGGQALWSEWLPRLRQLAVLTLRRPQRVLATLAELEPMAVAEPVGLDEVRRALEDRLTLLRVEPTLGRYGRVFVATVDEVRGRSFHSVFLPGLAEGIFPRRVAEDPLLLDEHRQELASDRLATRDRLVARERLLLRLAVGAAEEQLVVSYPTLDTLQGRARVPSFYALDVARAADGRLPDMKTLGTRAADASASLLGWPAPAVPALAVDAAEYDVASLAPLLSGVDPAARGRARFLLDTNEHLARSLRSRALRWRPRFSSADGLVAPDDLAMAALDNHRLARRSYSPTALQRFAICPYQFALHAIHRLRPRDEPAAIEQMDPLTRGSLFHEVQYTLLCRLRDVGALPVSATNRDQVVEIADGVLDEVAARYSEDLAPAIPRIWRDEVEGIRTDLRGWIRVVAEESSGWTPTYFEMSFGLGDEPGRDPLSGHPEAVVLEGHRLRGSIDLVEHNAERGRWRVTDHKTGRALRERFVVLGRGEVLQPLLYALAAEYHLGADVESGRLFYCTRRGDYEVREVALNRDSRAKVGQALGVIDRAIADGFLPAAPRARACEWCDYRSVCGPYEEVRIRRKDRRSLASLELLRGAP